MFLQSHWSHLNVDFVDVDGGTSIEVLRIVRMLSLVIDVLASINRLFLLLLVYIMRFSIIQIPHPELDPSELND